MRSNSSDVCKQSQEYLQGGFVLLLRPVITADLRRGTEQSDTLEQLRLSGPDDNKALSPNGEAARCSTSAAGLCFPPSPPPLHPLTGHFLHTRLDGS